MGARQYGDIIISDIDKNQTVSKPKVHLFANLGWADKQTEWFSAAVTCIQSLQRDMHR